MKKFVALFMTIMMLGMASLFVACSAPAQPAQSGTSEPSEALIEQSGEQASEIKIGFGLWFRRDQWWKDLEAEALKTASEEGVTLLIQDGDGDSAKQVQQFETWLAQDVDAIIYAPVDASATINLTTKAKEKNIPVICLETSLEDMSNVTSYFEFDQYQSGIDLGTIAAEFLNKNFGGTGKVAGVYDTTNVTVQIPRWEGFKAALKEKCPGAEIVAEQDGKNDRSVAMSVADNLLARDKDIQVWYGGMSDMAYGICSSMEAKGLDSSNYCVLTDGWGQETVDHLLSENNYLKGACITLGTDGARAAVKAVAAYLKNGTAMGTSFKIEMPIITKDNVMDYAAAIGTNAQ